MLIQQFADRPSTIMTREGVRVYVSVHDRWFLDELHRRKTLVRDMHPDRRWWTKKRFLNAGQRVKAIAHLKRPNSGWQFRHAKEYLAQLIVQETRYYATLGLRPPFARG